MTANASTQPNPSWLFGKTSSTTSPPLLSPDFWLSRNFIPLYLLFLLFLSFRLPSLLERLFTPTLTSSTSSFVIPAETRHARFLPIESQHKFRYNTLYLALRLDHLETRKLDTDHAFAWKGPILLPEFVDEHALAQSKKGVTPTPAPTSAVGNGDVTEQRAGWIEGSILLKLAYELRQREFLKSGPQNGAGGEWSKELGQVWTVTMPSIAGTTGINPLTVHYCYRPGEKGEDRGKFWLIVLEVHNTFSERHIYVLEAGKNEDGSEEEKRRDPTPFTLGIRLLLLIEAEASDGVKPDGESAEGSPKLVKKMMATLDSIPPPSPKASSRTGRYVRPLSPATLYAALMRQPLDLFLTFVRILYEAARLHFVRRLDVFGRPDMVQVPEASPLSAFDGVGLPPPLNQIQPHRSEADKNDERSVGLMYPEPGWAEITAKKYMEEMIRKRVQALEAEKGEEWSVRVESTDPADPGLHIASDKMGDEKVRQLVLYTRSYGVYVDLMTHQPPSLALLLGSVVGRRWGVNSMDAFDSFFPSGSLADTGTRKKHFDFLLNSHLGSSSSDREEALQSLQKFGIPTKPTTTKEGEQKESRKVTTVLWMRYLAAVAEKKAFALLGARYVKGTEPWLELQRGLKYIEKKAAGGVEWDTKLGSVYHP
ncbi:uncharacterized protein UBRO2_00850 [Ustilago bromivora]|uniref:Uncharacterized protein n=1 Tax=Ustilago bromivora TaxID=307758 RepID=A0A8H8QJ12_9BASI|nr:uncharacterized protein UBRO2_00850 [Ustilago bromivora]